MNLSTKHPHYRASQQHATSQLASQTTSIRNRLAMSDEYGADDALLAAMAAADPTPVARRPAPPQQPRPQKIQQPTPQHLDKAPPAASGSGGKVVQPTPQSLPARQGASNILVSPRQRGNPVLTHIKSMPWEYSDIPADYVLGTTTCALFLRYDVQGNYPTTPYTLTRLISVSNTTASILNTSTLEFETCKASTTCESCLP